MEGGRYREVGRREEGWENFCLKEQTVHRVVGKNSVSDRW